MKNKQRPPNFIYFLLLIFSIGPKSVSHQPPASLLKLCTINTLPFPVDFPEILQLPEPMKRLDSACADHLKTPKKEDVIAGKRP